MCDWSYFIEWLTLSMIPDNSNKEYAKNDDIWKFIQICYWLW